MSWSFPLLLMLSTCQGITLPTTYLETTTNSEYSTTPLSNSDNFTHVNDDTSTVASETENFDSSTEVSKYPSTDFVFSDSTPEEDLTPEHTSFSSFSPSENDQTQYSTSDEDFTSDYQAFSSISYSSELDQSTIAVTGETYETHTQDSSSPSEDVFSTNYSPQEYSSNTVTAEEMDTEENTLSTDNIETITPDVSTYSTSSDTIADGDRTSTIADDITTFDITTFTPETTNVAEETSIEELPNSSPTSTLESIPPYSGSLSTETSSDMQSISLGQDLTSISQEIHPSSEEISSHSATSQEAGLSISISGFPTTPTTSSEEPSVSVTDNDSGSTTEHFTTSEIASAPTAGVSSTSVSTSDFPTTSIKFTMTSESSLATTSTTGQQITSSTTTSISNEPTTLSTTSVPTTEFSTTSSKFTAISESSTGTTSIANKQNTSSTFSSSIPTVSHPTSNGDTVSTQTSTVSDVTSSSTTRGSITTLASTTSAPVFLPVNYNTGNCLRSETITWIVTAALIVIQIWETL